MAYCGLFHMQIDDTNIDTDPANHVYSEINESQGNRENMATQSPTKSTCSNDSNGSTRALYENINEDDDDKDNTRQVADNQCENNYDVIDDDNNSVNKKNASHLAPPSESENEHSVIEQFDEVMNKESVQDHRSFE